MAVSVAERVASPQTTYLPPLMDYSLRQAAVYTGFRSHHVKRLIDTAQLTYRYQRGIRMYDRRAVEEWWQRYRTRDYDRVRNLGVYRRRAVDAQGAQVCPGSEADERVACGAALGRTDRGRQRRRCDACRAAVGQRRAREARAALRAKQRKTPL
jgi:hypothetical protein